MSQNFSDKSNNPNENQAEIESLVAAFYAEHTTPSSRAEHLWRQLAAAPARRSLFGSWFKSANMARNNIMQTETPLFDQDAEIPAKPPRRRALATSLLGGMATLILVAGLILVVSLATGSKAPVSGPPVGSQGQAGQNSVAQPTPTLIYTPTPLPYNGTPVPGMVDPNASPTPTPFGQSTPTMVGSSGNQATPFPPTAASPAGIAPTVVPDGTLTPTPWDGISPVSPTVVPGAPPTPTPAGPKSSSSTDSDPKTNLGGADNVAVKYLQAVPINFNQNALPPHIRATNPAVSLYGAPQEGSTILAEMHAALLAAGYKFISADGSAATTPTWYSSGTATFYTKAGHPDLYISVSDLPTSEQIKLSIANGFDSGISDYEGILDGMRAKGIKTIVMITGGYNLYQVMRDGQDPGAGSPTVTPPPTK